MIALLSTSPTHAVILSPRLHHRNPYAPATPRPTSPAVTACTALANILKTSLGPVGLDKMMVRGWGAVAAAAAAGAVVVVMERCLQKGG